MKKYKIIKYIPLIGVIYSTYKLDKIVENPYYAAYHIYSTVILTFVIISFTLK